MSSLIDLRGQVFGLLAVVERGTNTKQGQAQWLCACDCGNTCFVRGCQLTKGRTKSCGCLITTSIVERSWKHGHAPLYGKPSPTYYSWAGMVTRCTNPKNKRWDRYGGRGIKVCERWMTFANFLADMGEKPVGKSLDRYPDQNGNYELGNCRWATAEEQARNRSNNTLLTLNGETKTIAEWAVITGISFRMLSYRHCYGWSDERTLTTPAGTQRENSRTRMVTANGETHTVAEWSRRLKVPAQRIYQRLHRGASDQEAVNFPALS